MKTLKTVLFFLAILILLIAGMVTDISAKPNRHDRREFAKRHDSCRTEQLRIQSSNSTTHRKHHKK